MEISNITNNYQVRPENVARANNSEVFLRPDEQIKINKAQDEKTTEVSEELQANKDSQRESATNTLAGQSKKSQVEISLATTTEKKENSIQNDTAETIETLRDAQKRNNTLQAHATYKENQNTPVSNLTRGLLN
ncbi:MAG: hypothetical protein COB42_01270 [Sulfurimonas sp.]|nr:MAG: hypothetical protein COB42_01270 [Sulfurimonas sp.]